MLRNVAFAFLIALAPVSVLSTGCVLECEDQDGVTVCTGENAVRFEAPARESSVAYTAGSAIEIVGENGEIRVVPGSGSEVGVSVVPFILDKASNEENASAHMEKNLEVSAVDEGGRVVVRVTRADGSSGALGGDVTVTLPAGFDGAFSVRQGNGGVDVDLGGTAAASTSVVHDGAGSISVSGARGLLEIVASTGDVTVDVDAWAASGDGRIFTDNGDIVLSLPAAADGTLTLTASDQLTESGVPETWTAAGEGNAKSYTMGAGAGGHVDVTADFGSISLEAR
jgi:hypothetical protein